MFEAVTLDTALALISKKLERFDFQTETVSLSNAKDRILSETIAAKEDVPSFFRSTVDGYAIKTSESFGASESVPALFKLAGKGKMGEECNITLGSGEAFYVPTGGMMPCNSDGTVMVEYTDLNGSEVFVYKPAHYKENTISVGEDIINGCEIFKRGDKLNALKIGALAALGITQLNVHKKIPLYIISTGDEIVKADEMPGKCKIRDANAPLISAALSDICTTVGSVIVRDEKEDLENAICKALEKSSLIVLSGGSSVGERDYTYQCLAKYADDVFIKGVSIKPGKPTMVASVKNKLIFGLAGHTMAAAVTCNLMILNPLLTAMGRRNNMSIINAEAAINFPSAAGRATVMPVSLVHCDGKVSAMPVFSKSGLISPLANADGYVLIKDKTEGIYKGENVEVYLL